MEIVAAGRRSLKIEVNIAEQIKSDDEVLLLKIELTKFDKFISVQVRNKCYSSFLLELSGEAGGRQGPVIYSLNLTPANAWTIS